MTQDTTPTSGAADLLELIEAYAEARQRQGHSSYNAQTATTLQAVRDALAQRFDAADMATAAASGFMDGVASLSANAGEPRNAIDRDALIDAIAQGLHGTWHCTRVWEAWHVGTMSQDDFEPVDESETPTEIADAVLALLAAPPTAQAEGWISVKDRLPEKNTEVLICFAELSIPSTGRYTASALDHEGWCYPQENHIWPGEHPDFEDGGSPTVTHRMPLPAAPGPADGESNE